MPQDIGLLDASHGATETVANFNNALPAHVTSYNITNNGFPNHTAHDGYVITGSASSVYDNDDWIAGLLEFIRTAHNNDTPLFGICFGHQAVAAALGGTVQPIGEYELGYREVTRRNNTDAVFDSMPTTFTVFATHSDRVTELPDDAVLLASNDYGIQGFRVRTSWGVQFHPEYDIETALDVTNRKDTVTDGRKALAVSTITPENYEAAADARVLLRNFADL